MSKGKVTSIRHKTKKLNWVRITCIILVILIAIPFIVIPMF